MLLDAALVVLAILWLREMIPRARKDFAELRRTSEPSTRGAIVLLWILTAFVALFLVNFLYALLHNFGAV